MALKFPTKMFGAGSALAFLMLFAVVLTPAPKISTVSINGVTYQIEIADTSAKRAKGLMNRSNLPQNKGMLFVFDATDNYTFWNKNTLIPLDLIYIDNDKIVEIGDLPAFAQGEEIITYTPAADAKYVLEINVGQVKKYGFKEGDEVKIQL